MLLARYMALAADTNRSKIESMFEEGEISRDRLINVATRHLFEARTLIEISEWFEEHHDDDVTNDAYLIVDETDDDFDRVPHSSISQVFVLRLRNDELDRSDSLQYAWNEDGSKAAFVFENHESFPDFPGRLD